MADAIVSEINTLTEKLRLHVSDQLLKAVEWPLKTSALDLVAELTEWGVRLHLASNVRTAIDRRSEELAGSDTAGAFRDRWREAKLYASDKSHDVQFEEMVSSYLGIPRKGTKEQRAIYLEAEISSAAIHVMSLERRRQRRAETGSET